MNPHWDMQHPGVQHPLQACYIRVSWTEPYWVMDGTHVTIMVVHSCRWLVGCQWVGRKNSKHSLITWQKCVFLSTLIHPSILPFPQGALTGGLLLVHFGLYLSAPEWVQSFPSWHLLHMPFDPGNWAKLRLQTIWLPFKNLEGSPTKIWRQDMEAPLEYQSVISCRVKGRNTWNGCAIQMVGWL
jgi:hypothetical protein